MTLEKQDVEINRKDVYEDFQILEYQWIISTNGTPLTRARSWGLWEHSSSQEGQTPHRKYKFYLSVKSWSRVATAPNITTDSRYSTVVAPIADKVPLGIDRWVSFKEADRFDPAIIPVTAGKNRPRRFLQSSINKHKLVWWSIYNSTDAPLPMHSYNPASDC